MWLSVIVNLILLPVPPPSKCIKDVYPIPYGAGDLNLRALCGPGKRSAKYIFNPNPLFQKIILGV